MATHPETKNLAAWLRAHPFTLAMSSGFFGFFAHCGVLWALEDHGLAPVAARGSSAGALVTGLWASGLPARKIAEELTAVTRADFWDPRPGFGFLAGKLFDRKLRTMLPVHEFERCRIKLEISVFDVVARTTRVVTNGDLPAAIRASCAVPLMFQPVWIGNRPMLDGGIADRSSLLHAPADERTLYHHLLPNSWWRRKASPAVQIPSRPNLVSWVVPGLPKVSPFRLEYGKLALERARAYTLAALGDV